MFHLQVFGKNIEKEIKNVEENNLSHFHFNLSHLIYFIVILFEDTVLKNQFRIHFYLSSCLGFQTKVTVLKRHLMQLLRLLLI